MPPFTPPNGSEIRKDYYDDDCDVPGEEEVKGSQGTELGKAEARRTQAACSGALSWALPLWMRQGQPQVVCKSTSVSARVPVCMHVHKQRDSTCRVLGAGKRLVRFMDGKGARGAGTQRVTEVRLESRQSQITSSLRPRWGDCLDNSGRGVPGWHHTWKRSFCYEKGRLQGKYLKALLLPS